MPPPPPPQENLDLLRLLLMQSGTRLLFNICAKTILTILISRFIFCVCVGGGGLGLGPPPLYEILVTPPFFPTLFCTLVGLPKHNILGVHVHMGC